MVLLANVNQDLLMMAIFSVLHKFQYLQKQQLKYLNQKFKSLNLLLRLVIFLIVLMVQTIFVTNVNLDFMEMIRTLNVYSVIRFVHLVNLKPNVQDANILKKRMNVMIVQKLGNLILMDNVLLFVEIVY
jgi:hypothetical protein